MPTFCYVDWDFGVPEVSDLQMDVTVHADLPGFAWMYLQAYDFRMYLERPEFRGRGIYSYHGLQSNVLDACRNSWRGKGLLYSRFETLDPNDLRVGPGGWCEIPDASKIAAEGGPFIGVRNSFSWSAGEYRLSLSQTDEDQIGIWYGFRARDLLYGTECDCGSLRFPKLDGRRPQIPNLGTTFLETNQNPAHFPFWSISIQNVVADHGKRPARTALVRYDDNQIPSRNSNVSLGHNTRSVEFQVGAGVVRTTVHGTLLRLQ